MEIRRSTCVMCRNGCQVGVVFDGYQYRVEYLSDVPPNNGRLCPRGNSASIIIDHPKRLSYPLLDGNETTWKNAFELMNRWIKEVKPEEIAVVYSRGAGAADLGLVRSFAAALETKNLVCGYLEADNAFRFRVPGVKSATLEDLSASRITLLVGDVFSTSPVAAKRIVEARYADKQSIMVVIDSIKTRQAGFAHIFVQPKPGTEFLVLTGIAALLDSKFKVDIDGIAKASGVSRSQMEEVAKVLKTTAPGLVACAASSGRITEPYWHSICAQILALKTEKPFVGFGEALVPEGKIGFGKLKEEVGAKKIKLLFWFGGLHPYSYPTLFPELTLVPFRVATSIFRPFEPISGLVLPVPSEFEKMGTGQSVWGEVKFEPLASPASGSISLAEFFRHFGVAKETPGETIPVMVEMEKVKDELTQRLSNFISSNFWGEQNGICLLGRKEAIGVGGFFDPEDEILIHPADARRLSIAEGDWVKVKSKTGERQFRVKVKSVVPEGTASVGINVHQNRALFSVEVDEKSKEAKIPPTKVEIWRVQA
ncbi:MAG: molybdopterin dinucleotide binding domain-containing protein [bacterium]